MPQHRQRLNEPKEQERRCVSIHFVGKLTSVLPLADKPSHRIEIPLDDSEHEGSS
jgi:hypothetical protein